MRSYVDLHLLNQRLPSLVYPDKPKFSFGPCHRQLFTYEVQKFLDKEMDRLILDTVLPPLLIPQGLGGGKNPFGHLPHVPHPWKGIVLIVGHFRVTPFPSSALHLLLYHSETS